MDILARHSRIQHNKLQKSVVVAIKDYTARTERRGRSNWRGHEGGRV